MISKILLKSVNACKMPINKAGKEVFQHIPDFVCGVGPRLVLLSKICSSVTKRQNFRLYSIEINPFLNNKI